MEFVSPHQEWANGDNQEAANALFEKWCLHPEIDLPEHHGPQYREPRLDLPTAEPPIFDYDEFVESCVPSDFQLQKLFPNDPVKKTMYRDTQTEAWLLARYCSWCESMVKGNLDPARAEFYKAQERCW